MMMMTRDEILKRVDELLDTYQPYTADNLGWLGLQLEKLVRALLGRSADGIDMKTLAVIPTTAVTFLR